jgi:hypothetical protein
VATSYFFLRSYREQERDLFGFGGSHLLHHHLGHWGGNGTKYDIKATNANNDRFCRLA